MLKIILNRSKPQAEKIIAEVKSQRMTTPSFAEKWRLQYKLQSLKKGKSARVDNIPAELVQAGGEDVIRSLDNLQQDLADRRMANPTDLALSHYASQERQPAAVPELPTDQPHQSPKPSHAEDHAKQIEVTSGEDHR